MSEQLIPFHQQAEDVGTFLAVERAREDKQNRRDVTVEGPSENAD